MERDRLVRASEPDSFGDMVLFGGIMLALPLVGLLALALPAWALWRWRGGWRIAAMVPAALMAFVVLRIVVGVAIDPTSRSEEHTSELQSLMRISYAVFCWNNKK